MGSLRASFFIFLYHVFFLCLYCVSVSYEDKKGSGGSTSSLVIFKNNINKYGLLSKKQYAVIQSVKISPDIVGNQSSIVVLFLTFDENKCIIKKIYGDIFSTLSIKY